MRDPGSVSSDSGKSHSKVNEALFELGSVLNKIHSLDSLLVDLLQDVLSNEVVSADEGLLTSDRSAECQLVERIRAMTEECSSTLARIESVISRIQV